MTADSATMSTFLALLQGSRFANARRRNGRPARIELPDDDAARSILIAQHMGGEGAVLTFRSLSGDQWREPVDAVELAAYCPGSDGMCRWLAIDLDATDHGSGGLADPSHAMRVLAERTDILGLYDGLLAARSRGGHGRHLFLLLPKPVPLDEAVIIIASWACVSFNVASLDLDDGCARHAFLDGMGEIRMPGDAGSVELIPRSNQKPQFGWAIALPAAGVHRHRGGGVLVDPFSDQPTQPTRVPRLNPAAWHRLVEDNQIAATQWLHRRSSSQRRMARRRQPDGSLHPLAKDFLEGRTPNGMRNASAFVSACHLLRRGVAQQEVETLILEGARRCDLPTIEARNAIKSARRAVERSQS